MRSELANIGREALARAVLVGIVGGVAGGMVGGAFIAAVLHRRRWLGYGAAIGAIVPIVLAAESLTSLRGIDYEAWQGSREWWRRPPARYPAADSGRTAVVASDLHANALVLSVLVE
jgi:hypothetical protein